MINCNDVENKAQLQIYTGIVKIMFAEMLLRYDFHSNEFVCGVTRATNLGMSI